MIRSPAFVFSTNDLPLEGSDHTRHLYISVVCSGHRVSFVLLDNGFALNVCSLATVIVIGFAPSDFGPSIKIVRAYESTQRKVMDTLTIDFLIGFLHPLTCFWANLGFTRLELFHLPFIRSHSDDDLLLIGFTFDEVQTLKIQDFYMSFLPGFGLGRRQHGFSEFVTTIDHDTPFGLRFTTSEDDVRYMARLRRNKGSEIQPPVEEIGVKDSIFDELQHMLLQMQMGDETLGVLAFMTIAPPSPNRASLFSLCFPDETTDYRVVIELAYMIDGVVPHDEHRDEMDMLGISQFLDVVQCQPFSPLKLFGVSVIKIAEEDQTIPTPKLPAFIIPTIDMYEGTIGLVERASNSMDSPLSFDILSGFVTRSDYVSDDSVMDLSIYEYSSVFCDDILLLALYSPTSQVRVCVDFRDLNKASPKDDFHLPHIDLLVDNTAGHSMLSFMDGFSGYNQILMAPEDREKTVFITKWGTYYYKVMPFGLKNAGATYQRATTTLFHDMMHRDVKVYVDDMIVKSRDMADHLTALERFFHRIRKFNERGIEVNPDKIRAILDMSAPKTEKEVKVLDIALGCMLAQFDDSGREQAIYHLSKRMLEYEMRYVVIEHFYLALV
ncbi:hypothetical protein AAG906_038352 [Vitis piasezkii]